MLRGETIACRGRGWGDPIRTMGQKAWHSVPAPHSQHDYVQLFNDDATFSLLLHGFKPDPDVRQTEKPDCVTLSKWPGSLDT
jgi:hypothetical protein